MELHVTLEQARLIYRILGNAADLDLTVLSRTDLEDIEEILDAIGEF